MKCKQCNYEINNDSKYCSNCGTKVEPVTTTQEINQPINRQSGYVPINKVPVQEAQIEPIPTQGGYVPITPGVHEEVVYVDAPEDIEHPDNSKKYYYHPFIYLVSTAMFLLAFLLPMFLPISNDSTTTNNAWKEDQTPLLFNQQTNNNENGYTTIYKDEYYIAIDQAVYRYSNDYQDKKQVINEFAIYLSVDDQNYYYCDQNYDYVQVNKTTQQKTILLENVYYVQKIDDVIYYQDDSDGETMYTYNMDTKTKTQITKERTYNIVVDQDNQRAFYTNVEGLLKMIDLENTEIKTIATGVYDYEYDGKIIYYLGLRGIQTYTVDTSKYEDALPHTSISSISLSNGQLVCNDTNDGLYVLDLKDGKKVISDTPVKDVEVLGSRIFYYDEITTQWIVSDLNGNKEKLEQATSGRRDFILEILPRLVDKDEGELEV